MLETHPTIPGAVLFDDDAKLTLDERCPAIIPISKNVHGRIHIEAERGHKCPCLCEHPTLGETIKTYSLIYKSEWLLKSNDGCDQVKTAMLLDGCHVSIKGGLKLREWDCPDNDDDAPDQFSF